MLDAPSHVQLRTRSATRVGTIRCDLECQKIKAAVAVKSSTTRADRPDSYLSGSTYVPCSTCGWGKDTLANISSEIGAEQALM